MSDRTNPSAQPLSLLFADLPQNAQLGEEAGRLVVELHRLIARELNFRYGGGREQGDGAITQEALSSAFLRFYVCTPAQLIWSFSDDLGKACNYVRTCARNARLAIVNPTRSVDQGAVELSSDGDEETSTKHGRDVAAQLAAQDLLAELFELRVRELIARGEHKALRAIVRRFLSVMGGYSTAELRDPWLVRGELSDVNIRKLLSNLLGDAILPWADIYFGRDSPFFKRASAGQVGEDLSAAEILFCAWAGVTPPSRATRKRRRPDDE